MIIRSEMFEGYVDQIYIYMYIYKERERESKRLIMRDWFIDYGI